MKRYLNLAHWLCIAFLFCTFFLQAKAIQSPTGLQQKIIRGEVRESGTNTALVGVNVRVKGRTGGTVTNSNGKYEIPIDSKESI
ncbi:MAG: carboxypeptidase-like regulatory domain-containing protein, partial [Sphingobacterium sp.]